MTNLRNDSVDFFLGATTPAGFKGYFEPLRHEPGMQMYLIKSGPGCGKSTLMKRLAQAAEQQGQPIEKIHCASDPDSLDGVVFLQKHAAILDATAPHVVEPDAPGADEIVVCLGRIAAQRMIRPDFSVTKEHGTFIEKNGILFMGTFHPAALLRQPQNKPEAFADFVALRDKINEVCEHTY